MEKPHIDTAFGEVPADLASPALYRIDAAHRPRVDRAEMLRYLGYGGQQIEPELSQRIELVVERLELDIEPVACAAFLPSMPRASMSRESLAFAWSAPTLSCAVAISIAISKTPALPHSWYAPSAWTPSVACAPREPSNP